MQTLRIKKLILSGISVITNNHSEMSDDSSKIPQLWEDYYSKNVHLKTKHKSNKGHMYGVYSDYTSDVNGDYKVTVAVEVKKESSTCIDIENEKYLVFSAKGELPDIVIDTWETIWEYFEKNSEYTRKYSIDFEKYISEDEIEIYISIL